MIFAKLYHKGQPLKVHESTITLNHRMTMYAMAVKVSKKAEFLRWQGIESDGYVLMKGKSETTAKPLHGMKIQKFTQKPE